MLVTGWILMWGEPHGRTYYSEPFPTAKMCFEAAQELPQHFRKKGCIYVKNGEKQGRRL